MRLAARRCHSLGEGQVQADNIPEAARGEIQAELRRIIHDIRPEEVPWFPELPQRARNVIFRAYQDGDLPNLQKSSVRAKGKRYWLRRDHLGPKTLKAIAEVVGGFDAPWTNDPAFVLLEHIITDHLNAICNRVTAIVHLLQDIKHEPEHDPDR
jgi:hypothetical protein